MSETRLSRHVIDNLGHTGHWSQVESHATSAGIPDLNYCINGQENWLELKFGYSSDLPKLRPTQCAWFRRRVKCGGTPRLLFKIDDDYGLINGDLVPSLVKAKTKHDWMYRAYIAWKGKIDWGELTKELV